MTRPFDLRLLVVVNGDRIAGGQLLCGHPSGLSVALVSFIAFFITNAHL
jgi:hypothetical protein